MNNGDMPATSLDHKKTSDLAEGYHVDYIGLTKREAFAMAAMQGLCAGINDDIQWSTTAFAETAVDVADALLKALEQDNG